MSAEERPPEAEFREYTRGKLPKQDEPEVHPWTGLIADPRIRAHLDYMARIYDPDAFEVEMPQKFSDTQYCQDIIAKYSTESGTHALLTGNVGHLNFYSGLVGYETDVSGMKTLMNLQRMMEQTPVWICYIYGLMGSGKTDFAFLLLEVMQTVWDEVYFMANIDSRDVDETNKHYSRIVSLLEERREKIQNGEDLAPVAILLDEAAQLLSGVGADQQRAKELAKLLKLARKSNAHVIMIGQDGKASGRLSERSVLYSSTKRTRKPQPCIETYRIERALIPLRLSTASRPRIWTTARGTKANSSSTTQTRTISRLQRRLRRWNSSMSVR